MATVTFEGVTRHFPGADRNAVDGLDLEIRDGELLVLVGPSGCGKTTTLRMLAGLEPVDAGRVLIGDDDVTEVAPKDRDIAMVFQNYALYPHLTVEQNMGFGLRTRGVGKTERHEAVVHAAKLLDLEPLLQRRPAELSGGQRQRVAMGRAIVREPRVFLMDEPLSNLDAKLRTQTRAQIATLQHDLGTTMVYVTHDQVEAMTMGDRIAVLDQGRIQQLGTPQELYDDPANEFVARFIGSPVMNMWTGSLTGGALHLSKGTSVDVPERLAQAAGANPVRIGVRAEDLHVVDADAPGIDVEATLIEELGADGYLYGTSTIGGEQVPITVRVDGRNHPSIGDHIRVAPNVDRLHVFRAADGACVLRRGER